VPVAGRVLCAVRRGGNGRLRMAMTTQWIFRPLLCGSTSLMTVYYAIRRWMRSHCATGGFVVNRLRILFWYLVAVRRNGFKNGCHWVRFMDIFWSMHKAAWFRRGI